ncbi:Hypothetical protein D9617_1g083180 [Elsinoe fawcettii]|nr:Hypothetical protein D9617_1g083180 [Elsinoe fawcettii]
MEEFCYKGYSTVQRNYQMHYLCHACDDFHLPHPCPAPPVRCETCSHLGHRAYYCPRSPKVRTPLLPPGYTLVTSQTLADLKARVANYLLKEIVTSPSTSATESRARQYEPVACRHMTSLALTQANVDHAPGHEQRLATEVNTLNLDKDVYVRRFEDELEGQWQQLHRTKRKLEEDRRELHAERKEFIRESHGFKVERQRFERAREAFQKEQKEWELERVRRRWKRDRPGNMLWAGVDGGSINVNGVNGSGIYAGAVRVQARNGLVQQGSSAMAPIVVDELGTNGRYPKGAGGVDQEKGNGDDDGLGFSLEDLPDDFTTPETDLVQPGMNSFAANDLQFESNLVNVLGSALDQMNASDEVQEITWDHLLADLGWTQAQDGAPAASV